MASPTPPPATTADHYSNAVMANPFMDVTSLVQGASSLAADEQEMLHGILYSLPDNPAAQTLLLLLQLQPPLIKADQNSDTSPLPDAAEPESNPAHNVPSRSTVPGTFDGIIDFLRSSRMLGRAYTGLAFSEASSVSIGSFAQAGLRTDRLVPARGNCGYEAAADALTALRRAQPHESPVQQNLRRLLHDVPADNPLTQENVRTIVQRFFISASIGEQQRLVGFVDEPGRTVPQTVEGFAASIILNGNWISSVELLLLAQALGLCIVTVRIQVNGQTVTVLPNPIIMQLPNILATTVNTVFVTLEGEAHYYGAVLGVDPNNPALTGLIRVLNSMHLPIPQAPVGADGDLARGIAASLNDDDPELAAAMAASLRNMVDPDLEAAIAASLRNGGPEVPFPAGAMLLPNIGASPAPGGPPGGHGGGAAAAAAASLLPAGNGTAHPPLNGTLLSGNHNEPAPPGDTVQ